MGVNMEKLFVKKLDDGKEFKIIFKLIDKTIALPFATICEYLGLSSYYWSKKLADKFKCSGGKKFLWLDESKEWITYVIPRSDEGKYWKKVILGLQAGEMLLYKSEEQKQYKDQLDELRIKCHDLEEQLQSQKEITKEYAFTRMKAYQDLKESQELNEYWRISSNNNDEYERQREKELTETKDQLELVRNHNTDLQFNLSNANDTIEFLQAKNKEFKKAQRNLNQALGIDLLNMAQQLLNMKGD